MTNNDPVDVSVEELQSQALKDKSDIALLRAQVDELGKALKKSNDLIEGDVKAKLIEEVEPLTDYKIGELLGMDTARLRQIRDDASRYVPERKRTSGVGIDIAADKLAPIRSIYGQYRNVKG